MASILYYSNFCNHSKSLLQYLSKLTLGKDVHFICIDKRIQENGKTFIVLESSQKIILPEQVTQVPALLNLSTYNIIYGSDINNHFKPLELQEREYSQQPLQNQQVQIQQQQKHPNQQVSFEPESFSLGSYGGMGGGIVSDSFCFLDVSAEDLTASTGNSGVRQMHSYVGLDDILSSGNGSIGTVSNDEFSEKGNRGPKVSIDQLKSQRDNDLNQMRR